MKIGSFRAETYSTENNIYKDIHTSVMEMELETVIS